jgi:hypothetical protein
MNTLKTILAGFLPILFFISCNENASNAGFEDPTDPSVEPRVVWAWLESPRYYYREWDKSEAHSDTLPFGYYPGRLLIRFNKIMIGYTVIPNASLWPKEDGFASISSSGATTFDGQTFEFPINGMFKVAKPYTIVVGKGATDVTDLKLESEYRKDIIPEPTFRVVSTYPTTNDTSFYQYQNINLYLNSCINQNSIAGNCSITPSINGNWHSSSSYQQSLYFNPESGFKSNTWYEVTVLTGFMDTAGHHLQSPFKFKFKTLPFKVNYNYPTGGQQNVNTTSGIDCNFTSHIDTLTVKEAFQISPNINGYFQFSNYYPSNYFLFRPYGGLSSNTTYTVTISTALRSLAGDSLPSPHIFSFKTIQ